MDYYVAIASIVGIHALLGLSVYLVAISGQMSFGQQGFFAIGAYLAGMGTALWGLPLLPSLVLGALLAGLIGIVVGFPALRVRGLYLAIATYGFGEVVRLVFLNIRYTKTIGDRVVGPNGAEGFRHVRYVFDRGFTGLQFLGIIAAVVAGVAVLFYLLDRSKLGAMLRAVEEDEVAAATVGIDVTRVKVLAFGAAGAVAGLGGGLFIHFSSYIDHDMVALPLAIASITYPILGGLGSFVGPILGAVLLVSLTEGLRVLHELRMFVYGGLIIVTMLVRPRGLVDEALVLRAKRWVRPRPMPRGGDVP
ncbi:MAG: branched-chain amino acid ABC transporter permease [Candidatus Rokubacteria bacterium]|nr:branched-chain amino acid ABC transporter permease [Candidatus Rokubacteria bacterium]